MRTILSIFFSWMALSLMPLGFVRADPVADFHHIIAQHWAWTLEQSPQTKSFLGDSSAADRWDDDSLAAHYERDARRGEFLAALASHELQAQRDSVDHPEDDEGPVSAVPEPTQGEGNHQRPHHCDWDAPAPALHDGGHIDVVIEPGRERDVPTAPVLGHRAR